MLAHHGWYGSEPSQTHNGEKKKHLLLPQEMSVIALLTEGVRKYNFVKFLVEAAVKFYNNWPFTLNHRNILSNCLIKKA